jgi:hypothetical protein
MRLNYRKWPTTILRSLCVVAAGFARAEETTVSEPTAKPNSLLCIADDMSWGHTSIDGDKRSLATGAGLSLELQVLVRIGTAIFQQFHPQTAQPNLIHTIKPESRYYGKGWLAGRRVNR